MCGKCTVVSNESFEIKGTVSRDFRPQVLFHQTIPPCVLIHGLMPFEKYRIILDIRDNRLKSSACAISV
jgi:hypothetical protein